jgi:mono/diheme cytochrome c family protein
MIMKLKIAALAIVIALAGAAAHAADGKELFDKQCAKCHGADGKGETKIGKKLGIKDLTDAKLQGALTDEKAFKSIKEGIKDGDKVVMKPAEEVNDEQIKALVAYVRKFKK